MRLSFSSDQNKAMFVLNLNQVVVVQFIALVLLAHNHFKVKRKSFLQVPSCSDIRRPVYS